MDDMMEAATWSLGFNSFHFQPLGMKFALIVRLGHNRRCEGHVAQVARLQPVRVSVVAILQRKDAKTADQTFNNKKTSEFKDAATRQKLLIYG